MFLPPPSTAIRPPVVELFTSEGCSSCPPAEALLSRYARDGRIILLEHHVDYWDRLGWRDPFSSAGATARQNGYAARFGLDQIYTPQAIVNGTTQFVGSDEAALRSSLGAIEGRSSGPISISIEPNGDRWRVVTPKITDSDVIVATVLPPQTVQVERGENGGRTLTHDGVVQTLRRLGPAGTLYSLSAPLRRSTLVVLVQRRGYREIVAATSKTR